MSTTTPYNEIQSASRQEHDQGGQRGAHQGDQQGDLVEHTQQASLPGQDEHNYVIDLIDLSETPDWIDCPHCKSRQLTKVSQVDSDQTTTYGWLCCLLAGPCCFCLPSLMHCAADTLHHCGGCQALVARKVHDGKTEPQLPRQNQNKKKLSQYPEKNREPETVEEPVPMHKSNSRNRL